MSRLLNHSVERIGSQFLKQNRFNLFLRLKRLHRLLNQAHITVRLRVVSQAGRLKVKGVARSQYLVLERGSKALERIFIFV